MYRPTVRYAEVYRDYVDGLFHATYLDRNQLIRAALFVAPFSTEYLDVITPHQKTGVILPSPSWNLKENGFWLNQNMNKDHVMKETSGEGGTDTSERIVLTGTQKIIRANGGITIKVGSS